MSSFYSKNKKEISIQLILFLLLVSSLKRLHGKDHHDIVKYLPAFYIEWDPGLWFDSSID